MSKLHHHWDILIYAVMRIAFGALGVIGLLGQPYPEETPQGVLFDALGGGPRATMIYNAIDGVLFVAAGYGLVKLRKYGWWINVTLVTISGIPLFFSFLKLNAFTSGYMLCNIAMILLWSVFLMPIFLPFGGYFRYERLTSAEGDWVILIRKCIFVGIIVAYVLGVMHQFKMGWWRNDITLSNGLGNALLVWAIGIGCAVAYGCVSYYRNRKNVSVR